MRRMFNVLLSLVITLSFSLSGYAGPNDEKSSAKRLGLFDFIAPNPVETQVPEQFFVDGKAPQSFIDGPKRLTGWKRFEKQIVERTKAMQTLLGFVPIAVYDTGMDPSVDYVRNTIMFDIKDDKVIGAGKDYVSGNSWGFPHNRDPWMYVFGSEGVTSDEATVRIKGPIEKPLDYLIGLNEQVMNALTKAVQSNPKLKNSFFAKMNSSNTNMIGLFRLANYEVNQEAIAQLMAQKKTLSPKSDPTSLDPGQQAMLNFAKTAWIMAPDAGLPDFFSMFDLENLHAFSEVQKEIAKIFETADGKSVVKIVSDTMAYVEDHHFRLNDAPNLIGAYTMAKISQQIAYKKLGSPIHSPSFEFYMTMRKQKALNPGMTWVQIVESEMDKFNAILQKVLENPKTRRDRAATATIKSILGSSEQVKKFTLATRDASEVEGVLKALETTGKMPWINGESSLNRAYAFYVKNGYLHRDSQDEYHGTHTGTTAEGYLQHLAGAVPYKIGLGLVSGNLEVQNEIVLQNLKALHEWMQKPVVAKAIYNTLTQESKVYIPVDIGTVEGQKKLADFMAKRFEGYLLMDASPSASGLVGQTLHWQLIDAIEDTVKRKIPFGNLSIGGEITQPTAHPTLDTADEKIGATMDFIFGEFQKYKVAEAMTTTGKNTLFFVAAGNSNNIGDGHMRTNYPADLRSKWLSQQKAPGEVLPGENLENIAIVESSNGLGRLSNFSNKVLTNNTQFLIRGENIRAQAMKYSLSTPEMVMKQVYPEVYRLQILLNTSLIPSKDARVVKAMAQLGIEPEQFELMRDSINEAIESVKHLLRLQYNDHRAEISGTSMATPSVAALAMLEFSEKLLKSGKYYYQVYGTEGYRPTDIVSDLVKKSILVEIGNEKNKISSLEKEQRFLKKTKREEDFTKKLNDSRLVTLECIRFYKAAGL